MSGAVLTRAERIARLNDLARRAMGIACVVVATEGIQALPEADQSRLRELVETFDAFTPDNDPYGERDFGAIWQGLDGVWSTSRPVDVAVTVFWKMSGRTVETLAHAEVSMRVLVLMC